MIRLKDTVIANQMLWVTIVIIVCMHTMAFQTVVLAIVTKEDPKMKLVKMEFALVQLKQLLVRNVIYVQRNILIFQIVNLANVHLKAVLIKLAMSTLEIVTVNQMWLGGLVMNASLGILDFQIA